MQKWLEYGPPPLPRRRIRIRNRFRLVVFLLIVFTIFVLIIPQIHRFFKSFKSIQEYIPYQVSYGDTYWDIAKKLQKQGYRSRTDIRDIVHELIQASGIPAHELKEGDIIFVPNIE